jgi:hypothetical protein
MAAGFKKGHTKIGGRSANTPNVATKEARLVLNKILIAEIPNLVESLAKVREKDDAKYIDCMNKLLSYLIPRRTDITTDDEQLPVKINITVADSDMADELKDFLNGTATDQDL